VIPQGATHDAPGGEQPPGCVVALLRITKPDGTFQDVSIEGSISAPRLVLEGRVPTDPPPQV
jgi:hypothetical protein